MLGTNNSTRQTPMPVHAIFTTRPVRNLTPPVPSIKLMDQNEDNFLEGTQELGIPVNEDLNSGNATGASIVPSSMTTKNQSRADARTAYLDPVLRRRNLHIVTGYSVARVLHDNVITFPASTDNAGTSSLNITGVEVSIDIPVMIPVIIPRPLC